MRKILIPVLVSLTSACVSNLPPPVDTVPTSGVGAPPQTTNPPTPKPADTTAPVKPSPPPVEMPLYAKAVSCDGKPWPQDWNLIIGDALDKYGQHLLPAQISLLCHGYSKASTEQRKAFWALFFAAVACRESGFDTKQVYHEPPPLSVDSIGLLQLSYGDERGHRRCLINKATQNITDPKINLACGVAILDDQLADGKGVFNQASYWSTLRQESPNHKYWTASKTKALFLSWANKLDFCL